MSMLPSQANVLAHGNLSGESNPLECCGERIGLLPRHDHDGMSCVLPMELCRNASITVGTKATYVPGCNGFQKLPERSFFCGNSHMIRDGI